MIMKPGKLFATTAMLAALSVSATAQTNADRDATSQSIKPLNTPTQAHGGTPMRGGGMPSENQVQAENLQGMSVSLKDERSFGTVADIVINTKTGMVDSVLIGQEGVLGVGQKQWAVPWNRIGTVDRNTKELHVDLNRNELTEVSSVEQDSSKQ